MSAVPTGVASPVDRFFQFSLLGLLASGYLAVLGSGYLDVPTIAITAAALLLRGLITAGVLRLEFRPGMVTAATLAYIAFYPIDYFYISEGFLPAAVHLVFFLGAVWALAGQTKRSKPAPPKSAKPAPADDDKELVEKGKALFLKTYSCNECHGDQGEGTNDGPDLIGTLLSAEEISKLLQKPSADAKAKGMPDFAPDSPDLKPLVAFVVSIKKPAAK